MSAKITQITARGHVKVEFSKEIVITDYFKERLMAPAPTTTTEGRCQEEPILHMQVLSPDSMTISKNLLGWKVTSVEATGLELDLTFEDPQKVSEGYEPDMLNIFLNLDGLEDTDGLPLAKFYFLKEPFPVQVDRNIAWFTEVMIEAAEITV